MPRPMKTGGVRQADGAPQRPGQHRARFLRAGPRSPAAPRLLTPGPRLALFAPPARLCRAAAPCRGGIAGTGTRRRGKRDGRSGSHRPFPFSVRGPYPLNKSSHILYTAPTGKFSSSRSSKKSRQIMLKIY